MTLAVDWAKQQAKTAIEYILHTVQSTITDTDTVFYSFNCLLILTSHWSMACFRFDVSSSTRKEGMYHLGPIVIGACARVCVYVCDCDDVYNACMHTRMRAYARGCVCVCVYIIYIYIYI